MEQKVEKKKYKNYLIILLVFVVISYIFGYLMYTQLASSKEAWDEIYEAVVNGSESQQEEAVEQINDSDIVDEDGMTKDEIIEYIETNVRSGEIYEWIDEGNDASVISYEAMLLLGLFHGYMLVVALAIYLEKRYLKGLNNVLRIILNVIIVGLLLPFVYYIMLLGTVGLPFAIIYCFYKYRKLSKNEKKLYEDESVEVMGKVDADEVFETDKDEVNNSEQELNNVTDKDNDSNLNESDSHDDAEKDNNKD